MTQIVRAWMCLFFGAACASAEQVFRDSFEDLAPWSVIASDGVRASLASAEGASGKALRLDFEFTTGAGFCVVRRPVDFELPANYRFWFQVRAEAPLNNFEFKLVDPSGENVWWVNRRDFEFPRHWRAVAYNARHFRFAWGPSGGKPLERVGFLEFAIAAGSGGKGWVLLDDLQFESLPAPSAERPLVRTSSRRDGTATRPIRLPASGEFNWTSDTADLEPWIEIDLTRVSEMGGLVLEWEKNDFATDYQVQVAGSDATWRSLFEVKGGNGGRDYLPLSDIAGGRARLAFTPSNPGRSVSLRGLRVMGPEFGESSNALMKVVAGDAPRGWYPEYFRDRHVPWTVIGAAGHDREALIDAHGAIEVDKLGFRIEPFIFHGRQLVTWVDATVTQGLADGYLPIPTVTWAKDGFKLEVTAFADGGADDACLMVRYRFQVPPFDALLRSLSLAFRPFQVLPPWHELNVTGGVSPIKSIQLERAPRNEPSVPLDRVVVKGRKQVQMLVTPGRFGASEFMAGEAIEHLGSGGIPSRPEANDSQSLASAAVSYSLPAGESESYTVVLIIPFHDRVPDWLTPEDSTKAARQVEEYVQKCSEQWAARLNRVQLFLPPSAKKLSDTFKSVQAHILINADGPAIQPGSRTYERSWIRDGALTSAALLATGHAEQAKAFLDWYAGYQFPSGKIPCVVDRRGPDPVPEHDSTGEYVFALLNYYRFTDDRALLERHWPRVVAAVDYLEKLRGERMTLEYRDGPPEKRVLYGLVPESISHEGYSAKPMHSYWDDFFVLKGFKDAAAIAEILGHAEEAARFAPLRDDFRKTLYDSMRLAMDLHKIDYIPGCAELGDFDATSTTIGVWPCGELGQIPEPQLSRTFERYLEFFRKRRDGAIEWDGYTPYELRAVGTFVRLGRREVAHELLDFFLADQQPPGWNQWPEVVFRDPATPRFIGDMPHTWVGSDFLNAARSMFVYERESDDTVVLAAGVAANWPREAGGVRVTGFPTHYGTISYSLSQSGDIAHLEWQGDFRKWPKQIVFQSPDPRRIREVEVNGQRGSGFSEREVRLLGDDAGRAPGQAAGRATLYYSPGP